MASPELDAMVSMIRAQMGDSIPTIEQLRAQSGASAALAPGGDDIEVSSGTAGDWVSVTGGTSPGALVHLHGGGYAVGSPASSRDFAVRLSRATRRRVLVVDYRLAPEHPFPAALEDSVAAYCSVLDRGTPPGSIGLVGESSGGGLVLATLLALRERGVPLPAAAVCMSPWTDLALTGSSMTARVDRDPLVSPGLLKMMADAYLAGQPTDAPLASPLYGDFTGLPPILVQTGTEEILFDDSVRFAERAQVAGVDVTLDIWDGMIHTWQLFAAFVPEGQQAIDRIGEYLTARLPQ
jgi:acetyl esterase/lipase